MMAARAWLIALLVAGSAAAAHAAPAPVAKPPRNVPSPATLLADLRAEGFAVRDVERGPEPGTYLVVLPLRVTNYERKLVVIYTKFVVRTAGPDVRSALRAFLQKAPRSVTLTESGVPPRPR